MSRGRASARPFGPYPLDADGKSVRIPVKAGDAWQWTRIDADWYGRSMSYRWRMQGGYVVTNVFDVVRRASTLLLLHRMITNPPAHIQVDHKRHNVLDNRRRALRWATPSQNSANTRRFSIHSSRYRGVTRHKSGKWQSAAKHNNVCFYLGLFVREEDAAEAYNRKARELWGKFAILNRLPTRRAA